MKSLSIELPDSTASILNNLSPSAINKLADVFFNGIMTNGLYPTGTKQLELALELLDAGVPVEIVAVVTRLDPDVVAPFAI